jgi:hypothetical protein
MPKGASPIGNRKLADSSILIPAKFESGGLPSKAVGLSQVDDFQRLGWRFIVSHPRPPTAATLIVEAETWPRKDLPGAPLRVAIIG